MRASLIKAIPREVKAEIKRLDAIRLELSPRNITRYYSYFDAVGGDLAKVTVAVKSHPKTKKPMIKQVAVHGIGGWAFARDMDYTYVGGYQTYWHDSEIKGVKEEPSPWVGIEEKYFNPMADQVCLERLENTPYKYSGYKQCNEQGIDVFEYLKTWSEHPKAELLMKAGIGWLCRSKRIINRCEMDKPFIKFIRRNVEYLRANRPSVPTIIRAFRSDMPIANAMFIEEFYTSNSAYMRDIKAVVRENEINHLIAYLEKNNVNKESYADYAHACVFLGIDMSDTKNKYPAYFDYWHNMRLDQYYAQTDCKMPGRMADVSCKYKRLQYSGKYCVIIAKSKFDLEREGKVLQHCVGRMNYDVRMAEEKSLIFFVRNTENLNMPYVTLEYSLSQKKVVQCYGAHDSRPSQEVIDFVYNKWQPYATEQLEQVA